MEYVEQLSAQTTTNVDAWPMLEVLKDITPGDKRAINKAFFAYSASQEQAKQEQVIPPRVEKELEESSALMDEQKRRRIDELKRQAQQDLERHSQYAKSAQQMLTASWGKHKEIQALEGRPANYIAEEVKRLIKEGFWAFEKYDSGYLYLTTVQDVIMSERNKAAGVNRVINFGKLRGVLQVRDAYMQVHRYLDNLNAHGHWHTYVSSSGDVCWGNASTTAAKLLSSGQIYESYMLLASLLQTYSPDSTPHMSLSEFAQVNKRRDSSSRDRSFDEINCDEHDDYRAECGCDYCYDCEDHIDYCTCNEEPEETDLASPTEPSPSF
jgi:hypothetical protein